MKDPELLYGPNISIVDVFMNEKKSHNALAVVRGMERFIEDNFRTLAEITADVPDDATLFVSIESVAMFFGDVFNLIFGRAMLKMDFSVQGEKLVLYMTPEPALECPAKELSRLIRFARDVGFDLVKYDDRIVLTIDCYKKTSGRVYVPLVKDETKRFAEIFENAFYKHRLKI